MVTTGGRKMAANDPGIAITGFEADTKTSPAVASASATAAAGAAGAVGADATATDASTASRGAAVTREWLITVPDHEGALQKRVEVRDTHLRNIRPLVQSGVLTLGGATLDAHPDTPGELPKMNGSVLILVADSTEQVLKMLRGDIYATSGVWNVDKAVIIPFRSAIREPL